MWQEIIALYRTQSIIPYVMLAFICVGYAIIFERFLMLKVIYKIPFEHFNTQIRRMILVQDYERARILCKHTGKTGLPLIAIKAIDAMEHNPYHTAATLQEEYVRFSGRIWRRIDQLPYFAAALLILGCLCSMEGLWNAFSAVRSFDLSLKSFLFSEAVLRSLLPMILGLSFVFLLVLPYGFLMGMANRLENEIEHSLCMLSNLLGVVESTVTEVPSTAASPPASSLAAPTLAGVGVGLESEASTSQPPPSEPLNVQEIPSNANNTPVQQSGNQATEASAATQPNPPAAPAEKPKDEEEII